MTAPAKLTTTDSEAIDHVAAELNIWIRLAAIRQDDGGWRARLLELTSGETAPPSWEPREWDYPSVFFVGAAANGQVVAEWLRTGRVDVDDRTIGLPELTTPVSWERRQSRSPAPCEPLDWPVTEATLSQLAVTQGEPQGHLLSNGDAPSFVNFYTAAACFFWLDRQPVGGRLYQGVVYRHQDLSGRINTIRIGHDEVEVEVEGSAIDGMTL